MWSEFQPDLGKNFVKFGKLFLATGKQGFGVGPGVGSGGVG